MVTLIDGGFSQVSSHIKQYVENHPLWNAQFLISHPQAVIETHKDYVRVGADIITTNTYQASINGFQEHLGLNEKECIDLIKKAVHLAKQAVDEEREINPLGRKVMVAGSVGPYGACLHNGSEYTGEYIDGIADEELTAWHRSRLTALSDGGVDLFAIETIPALRESLVLCDLIKEFPDKKAWISFTCKDEKHTAYGDSFKKAVEACWKRNPNQLLAVGMNCLNPILVTPLLKSLGNSHNIPIIVYPNSGETWDHDLGWCNPENRVSLMNYLPEWIPLGVQYIGGCCRTTSEDIKSFRQYIDNMTLPAIQD